jgi:DNA-binding CsgD family transcriptional regulator
MRAGPRWRILAAMNSPIEHRILALFAACQGIASRAGFMDDVHPLLKDILPHERFVCGIATVAPVAVLDVVNAGLPDVFVDGIVDRRGRIASPVIRHWLMQDTPVYFDEAVRAAFVEPEDAGWLAAFRQHGMRNMIAHGVKDLHGGATSYFCFAGVPDGGAERQRLLQLLVPHLHAALRTHYRLKQRAQDVELSCREREVLQLVCVGKTNEAIGTILGISPWTVKVHVRNFMAKLNVSTRGHAAAMAMKNGLVTI